MEVVVQENFPVEQDGHRRPQFEANFALKVLGIDQKVGVPSIYEFRLTLQRNRRILQERNYTVTLAENRFQSSLEEFSLATGQYLDLQPSSRHHQEQFVRQAIREYFETNPQDDEDEEEEEMKDRVYVVNAGVRTFKGNDYFIASEKDFFLLERLQNDGTNLVRKISKEDAPFRIIFKGGIPMKFGTMESGKIRRVLPEGFCDTNDGTPYIGPTEADPEITFETDEKEAIRLLLRLCELMSELKDEDSRFSFLQFFLQFNRGLLFDNLRINHKVAILCSEVNNSGKSAYEKMMSIMNFGYVIRFLKGFTEPFLAEELVQSNIILVFDELTKNDSVEEFAKGNWLRGVKGKATNKQRGPRIVIPRSTAILATNMKLEEFVRYHKIGKPTWDKLEFNYLGAKSVDQVNPDNFASVIRQAFDLAENMFRFSPIYLAMVKEVCTDRVSEDEVREMKKHGDKIGERLAESLAHLHRLWKLLNRKASFYGLHVPECLTVFDPRCLTAALMSEEKTFKKLLSLILEKTAVHLIEVIEGTPDMRLNSNELETEEWFPDWGANTYEKMKKCQKKGAKDYKRWIRVSRNDVGGEVFKKAIRLIKVTVDERGEEEFSKIKKRNTDTEKEAKRALGLCEFGRSAERSKETEEGNETQSPTSRTSEDQIDTSPAHLDSQPPSSLSLSLSPSPSRIEGEIDSTSFDFFTPPMTQPSGFNHFSFGSMSTRVSNNNSNGDENRENVDKDIAAALQPIGNLHVEVQDKSSDKSTENINANGKEMQEGTFLVEEQGKSSDITGKSTNANGEETPQVSSGMATTAQDNEFKRKASGKESLESINLPSKKKKTEFHCGNDLCKKFGSQETSFRKSERKTAGELLKEENNKILDQLRKENDDDLDLKIEIFPKKGRGIVTTRDYKKGEFVCEYVGVLMTRVAANLKEKEYSMIASAGCYMYFFKYQGKNYCIDATKETTRKGRLLNHSFKTPNLIPKKMLVDDSPRLYFVAKHDIAEGQEVVYDYGERRKAVLLEHPWLKE